MWVPSRQSQTRPSPVRWQHRTRQKYVKEEKWMALYIVASMSIYIQDSVRWTQKRPLPWTCYLCSMDNRDESYHERKPHSGCNPLRHPSIRPSPMVSVVVFSLDKSQPQVREQRDTCGQISGLGQQRNRADV